MTEKVVGLLYRSIIQHINGDKYKAEKYAEKAIELDEKICKCGGNTITCRYNKRPARLCIECGLVWQNKRIVQRCWVNSRRAV